MKIRTTLITVSAALAFAAAVSTARPAAQSQDITGTWQGTLQPPDSQPRREVIKIQSDGSTLGATFYSIDQTPQPFAATVTRQGASTTISVPALSGTYEGRLTADGTAIDGTWTRNGQTLPLNLKRVTGDAAWAIPTAPAPPTPMAADANPSFEVATIKPSKPDAPGFGIFVRGRQLSTLNTTVSDMVTFAYGLHARQIVGAPTWFEQDKYDVLAVPAGEGQPNDRQWRTMLQKLLADRFRLVFHRDKKELSAYAIVVVEKTVAKLAKSADDPSGLPALGFRALGNLNARNSAMTDFAGLLQAMVLDRPVVDQTALSGRFDFTLLWTPDQSEFGGRGPAATNDLNAPPGLFTAIQEQLGLKLDPTKAMVDVLVIDRVERPTPD